jgi:nucleoside-diphosphate-sugar epimerase
LSKIIYTTGLTGFIGRNLLPFLKKKYSYILNFRRDDVVEVISSLNKKSSRVSQNLFVKYPPSSFLNLATYYNPSPENVTSLEDIIEANIFFPLRIIEKINSENVTFINTSSYMQLLDNNIQNEYALSKQIFLNKINKISNKIINIYLYDSFGKGDTRNKVVDVFIIKILKNESITIPADDIDINISSVDDICNSLSGSLDIDYGDYSIMSNNTIKLYDLILVLNNLIGNNVEVIKKGKSMNLMAKISKSPQNIYQPYDNKSLEDKLMERINEIRKACSL